MTTLIEQQLNQIPTKPRGRPRTHPDFPRLVHGLVPSEYKKQYYEAHKPKVSRTEQKKINKLGQATLCYLKEKGYPYHKIATIMPRSPATLMAQYKALPADYNKSPDYAFYVKFIDKHIPHYGPINIEDYYDHPDTHSIIHEIEQNA